ncbi:hypothetical protein AAMO2058_001457900 [Amorphochlora amoebiformis]
MAPSIAIRHQWAIMAFLAVSACAGTLQSALKVSASSLSRQKGHVRSLRGRGIGLRRVSSARKPLGMAPRSRSRFLDRRTDRWTVASSELDYAVIRFKIPGVDEEKLPGYLGAAGLIALIVNHFTSEGDIPTAQVRSEVIGTLMGIGCLAIPALSSALDAAAGNTERPPPLAGTEQGFALSDDLPETKAVEIAWASASLLINTNAHRLILLRHDGEVMGARGFFPSPCPKADNLLRELSDNLGKYTEGGMEDLGISPGDGLALRNAQSIVIEPIGSWGSLWAITDAPRALSKSKSRTWLKSMARKLTMTLNDGKESDKDMNSPHTSSHQVSMSPKESTASYVVDGEAEGIITKYRQAFRSLPLAVGFPGLLLLLANRFLSGDTPTEHVTQADLASFPLGTALTLTGLIWILAYVVNISPEAPPQLARELRWIWDSLSAATRCKSLAVIRGDGTALIQAGLARKGGEVKVGPITQRAMETEKGSLIANLQLNSGKMEFAYFPEATQSVLVKPASSKVVMVLGSDTVRGFTQVDQAWVSSLTEKLSVTMSK